MPDFTTEDVQADSVLSDLVFEYVTKTMYTYTREETVWASTTSYYLKSYQIT